MKISEIFNLNKTQSELDFVDIDIEKDKSVFIDPFFMSTREDPWCIDATRTVKSFFQFAIDLIKLGKSEDARKLFIHLEEPNDTCLGVSHDRPQGRGVEPEDSDKLFKSIMQSRAIETGLVKDLEDSSIFIDGIDKDKVSDMTTNIIRKHLIKYTQQQCLLLGIPLQDSVSTRHYWESAIKSWRIEYAKRLVIDNHALLFVPKVAVSYYKEYTNQKYYNHDILDFLRGEHLQANSHLVIERRLQDGRIDRKVLKKDIKEETPFSKEYIRDFTKRHPEIFEKFKSRTANSVKAISNEELDEINRSDLIDLLIGKLSSIKPGNSQAGKYHSLMVGILELIFYPNLINPIKEREVNEGRKRIDITFDNGYIGFFLKLATLDKISSRYIMIECKNYSEDPKNPELDQLSGRLNILRGMFGLLICRSITNKADFMARCRDYWTQKQELMLPITDEIVIEILKRIKAGENHPEEKILDDLKREIILK